MWCEILGALITWLLKTSKQIPPKGQSVIGVWWFTRYYRNLYTQVSCISICGVGQNLVATHQFLSEFEPLKSIDSRVTLQRRITSSAWRLESFIRFIYIFRFSSKFRMHVVSVINENVRNASVPLCINVWSIGRHKLLKYSCPSPR